MQNPGSNNLSTSDDFDLRSKVVERTLEPLFVKLRDFRRNSAQLNHKPSFKFHDDMVVNVEGVLMAIDRDTCVIEDIPEICSDLEAARNDLIYTGNYFRTSLSSFLLNPNDSRIHDEIYYAWRALLSSLSRLLILADIADIFSLNQKLDVVLNDMAALQSITSHKELTKLWDQLYPNVLQVSNLSSKRSKDLFDPIDRKEIDAAIYVLKHYTPLLYTTSKVCLRYQDSNYAKDLQTFVVNSTSDAAELIQSILDGSQKPCIQSQNDTLLELLKKFENSVFTEPGFIGSTNVSPQIGQHLKALLEEVYRFSNSPQTNPLHRMVIHNQCVTLDNLVADLLEKHTHKCSDSKTIDDIISDLLKSTDLLKQLLVRCVTDQVIGVLISKDSHLMVLSDSTKFGCVERLRSAIKSFKTCSSLIISTVNRFCSLSSDELSVGKIRFICDQLRQLTPQVVIAAEFLFKYSASKSVGANYNAFKKVYEDTMCLLQTLVKDLFGLHDFLAVSDDALRADYDKSLIALTNRDAHEMQQLLQSMQQRAFFVCETVTEKMMATYADYSQFVDRVMEKLTTIREQYIPKFVKTTHDTISHLAANRTPDEWVYRKLGKKLCTGIHDLRLSILDESDVTYNEDTHDENFVEQVTPVTVVDEIIDVGKVDNGPTLVQPLLTNHFNTQSLESVRSQENHLTERAEIFSSLTEPQRETVVEHLAGFLAEKKRFMHEVVKWDDSTNEIIVLAKKMCVVMLEMTDFIRGKGPLRSNMEVIQAAQHISELGQRLNDLCRNIADTCPDSVSRQDLLVYLQRITLFCHQLKITSRVKAGLHMLSDEMFESSTSLIQAAKNLMTSVVLTVKESYIASTKYVKSNERSSVQWQMRTPEKKPLVNQMNFRKYPGALEHDIQHDALRELSEFKHPSPV